MGTGYNFTDRVRHVLQAAREEAEGLHHGYVGTEHILLGLLRIQDSTAAAILTSLNVSPSDLRESVQALLKPASGKGMPGPDLPYTSRGKKVLEEAMTAARELGHGYVGTEHLLLGLFREGKGVAAEALTRTGLTMDQVRAEALRVLSTNERQGMPHAFLPRAARSRAAHTPAELYSSARLALLLAVLALAVAITALALSLR